MTSPDMMSRPSASRILAHPFLRNLSQKSRSNMDLQKELREAKKRLKELEEQLLLNNSTKGGGGGGGKSQKRSAGKIGKKTAA